MISIQESTIVDKLLNKYEKSKSFIGDNKVNQTFTVNATSLFPKYADHSNYEMFQAVNEAIDVLVRKHIIIAKANSANVYQDITLNLEQLDQAYQYINRVPKKEINTSVIKLLNCYKDRNEILNRYCNTQFERINKNKTVQFFNDDFIEFENILIAVEELFKLTTETFVRDFSVRVFRNSKIFEGLCSKVINLLYEYGDFAEREQVLGNLNVIKNPTYVYFKGRGLITIKEQGIDLSKLSSDIAVSSVVLPDIDKIEITCKAVITIENLTSFHSFHDADMFAIYLGGYHNSVRREFIKKIYQQNPEVIFYHFGDIDAGGFYILEHLKRETGVNFKAYKMDVDTMKGYHNYSKELTDHDRDRLLKLKGIQYDEVITYMLENNCKLEQEAINAD